MSIPCLLFHQATVGVHYLVSMSICCAKKHKFDYTIVLAYIKYL